MTGTTTPQHRDERPVTAPLWAWERFLTHAANDDHWNHADDPGLGEAWNVLMAAKAEALGHPAAVTVPPPSPPPLPPVLEIRSRDGLVVAEIGPGPDGRFVVHLPVAYEAPETLAALPAGDGYGGEPLPARDFDERYDEDGEPADAFAGPVDPEAAF